MKKTDTEHGKKLRGTDVIDVIDVGGEQFVFEDEADYMKWLDLAVESGYVKIGENEEIQQ